MGHRDQVARPSVISYIWGMGGVTESKRSFPFRAVLRLRDGERPIRVIRAFGLGLMGVAVDAPELQDTPKDPRRGIH